MSPNLTIKRYIENIFWLHSKTMQAAKGGKKETSFNRASVEKLTNSNHITSIASQLTSDDLKLSEETRKVLVKRLNRIRSDFSSLKALTNKAKLENRIQALQELI